MCGTQFVYRTYTFCVSWVHFFDLCIVIYTFYCYSLTWKQYARIHISEAKVARTVIDKVSREIVNEETGEVILSQTDTTTRSISFESEPEYIKMYLKTISAFVDIRDTSSRLFYELAKRMEYADKEQLVYLNPVLRKKIQESMGVRKSAFDKALRELRDNHIIKKVSNNTFAINPNYVGRGKWSDIRRLRATFDFITGDVYADFGYGDE